MNIRNQIIYERGISSVGKKIAAIVAKAARLSAEIACNTTSVINNYQPVAPKQLKSTKPEKK